MVKHDSTHISDDITTLMHKAKKRYRPRLIDSTVESYLNVFGAISIEGPKWCGKTWTGFRFANSVITMADQNLKARADIDPASVLFGDAPLLIDEWTLSPGLWDTVRYACDFRSERGNFILTCSTRLTDEQQRQSVKHSGAGRIARLNMHTMSLFETGDSTGSASLSAMKDGTQRSRSDNKTTLSTLAQYIIRGGWPENLTIPQVDQGKIPASYIDSVIQNESDTFSSRDTAKLRMLLKSLARNESSIAGDQTLVKDIIKYEGGEDLAPGRHLVDEYLNDLNRLHLLEDQPAFGIGYRSSARIGKTAKHHLADPSLAAALLGLTKDKLLDDLNTMGFLFESLAAHDLRVYADHLGANLYHFRDNTSGDEVDIILEFPDGEYAAIEAKLGFNAYEEAAQNLLKFADSATRKPRFLLAIVGAGMGGVVKDPSTGVYIAALTSLGI